MELSRENNEYRIDLCLTVSPYHCDIIFKTYPLLLLFTLFPYISVYNKQDVQQMLA